VEEDSSETFTGIDYLTSLVNPTGLKSFFKINLNVKYSTILQVGCSTTSIRDLNSSSESLNGTILSQQPQANN